MENLLKAVLVVVITEVSKAIIDEIREQKIGSNRSETLTVYRTIVQSNTKAKSTYSLGY